MFQNSTINNRNDFFFLMKVDCTGSPLQEKEMKCVLSIKTALSINVD